MPIDPSLILGLKQPQLSAPDPLEQYGKSLSLQHLLQQGRAEEIKQQQMGQLRDSLTANGGDLDKTISSLLTSPEGIQLAAHLAPLAKQRREETMLANTPDMARMTPEQADVFAARAAAAGHPGALGFAKLAELKRSQAEQKAGIAAMQSSPGVVPATPNDDDGNPMPSLPAKPGVTDFLQSSPYVGNAAKSFQQLIDSGASGMTPQMIQSHLDRLQSHHVTQTGLAERQAQSQNNKIEIRNMFPPAPKGSADPSIDTANPDVEKNLNYWAEVIRKGGALPPGLARNREGAAFVKEVMKRVPQGDTAPAALLSNQAEFGGEKAGQRTLGNRTANIEMAVAEAKNVIPLAVGASDKVSRTEYPTLNSVILAAQKGTGGTDVVQLGVATNSLINVYARAISPTGTPTVSDKDHAREILEKAYSKGQYRAAVSMMEREMDAAKRSPGQVKKSMREQFTGSAPETSPAKQGGDFSSLWK